MEKRTGTEPVQYIETCPECHSILTRREGEAQHFCLNENECPPQIKGRIEHFISRKAMDIEGLGAETVDLLVEKQLLLDPADLYQLNYEQLIQLDRMADKSVLNLLNGLEKSKEVPFERVLFGIGIRFVGETIAKKLAKKFKNIQALMEAKYDDLVATDEIGEKIALSVQQFCGIESNRRMIQKLVDAGLNFEIKEVENASQILQGKVFVVSGVFEQHSRDELKVLIESNGGKVASSISNKTNYVLAGSQMGPAKLAKANDLNIPIIDEVAFVKMLTN